MNHFQLLDIEKKYDLDLALLQRQYFSKQILHHPDKASNEAIRRANLEKSMQLNEAYKILRDDYLRAIYMLKLAGVELDDRVHKHTLNASDLEEMIDLHEAIDEMEELSELAVLENQQLLKQTKLVQALAKCFSENNIANALDLAVRLKYLTNLVGNIKLKIKNANYRAQ